MALPDLLARRDQAVADMRSVNDCAEQETRDLSAEEKQCFDKAEADANSLSEQINRARTLEAFERHSEAAVSDTTEASADQPELRGYSIGRALHQGGEGRLDGLEGEWHEHLLQMRGNAKGTLIPTAAILGDEQRAVTTTTPAAGPGSNLVQTDLARMTDRRRAPLRVAQLGVTVLRNLVGDLELPRLASSGTAFWLAEHQDTTGSDASFNKKNLSLKTVSGEYEMSRKLMLQSQEAVDQILMRDLAYVLSQALDKACILGGGPGEVSGLLNDPEVSEVATAGQDIGVDTSLQIKALEVDDVYDEAAYLTHPAIMHEGRVSRDTTQRPLPEHWMWHGRQFTTSTQVPTTMGADGDLTPIIYGAWSNAYLGFWSGVDILQNPYDQRVSSKGGLLLQAFLDADFLVRHPEAFNYVLREL